MPVETVKRYCIIGAGASGLPVAKTFAERGIPFDCFEALADVGGIWNPQSPHVVYGSTYLNSSKKLSKYPDYEFPEEWPHYLSRAQAQDYLRSYAREFGLYDRITFNARVASAERVDGRWRIQIEGEGSPRFYDGLVVANGHHWHPNWPNYSGAFTGEILHSHDVKSKEQLKGKRVLVVGAGNSAVDILDDAAHDGARAVHSMRRSYYFFPKLVLGKPTDAFIDKTSRWPLPRSVMRYLYWWGLRITVGSHWKYNLPAPDHKLFEAHPTACTLYLDHIAHGRIVTKPDIETAERQHRAFLRWHRARRSTSSSTPPASGQASRSWTRATFWMRTAAQSCSSTPSTASMTICSSPGCSSRPKAACGSLPITRRELIASFIVAMTSDPKHAAWFRKLKASATPDIGHGIPYKDTPWHKFEIHHYRFRKYMARLLRTFGASATLPFAGKDAPPAQADGKAQLKLAS